MVVAGLDLVSWCAGMILTDEQWAVVEPLLPALGAKRRPQVDEPSVSDGMLYEAKTGIALAGSAAAVWAVGDGL